MANEDTALELEVMSWRMEPCGTMVVDVEAGTGAGIEAAEEVGRDTGSGTTGEKGKKKNGKAQMDPSAVKLLHMLTLLMWSSLWNSDDVLGSI